MSTDFQMNYHHNKDNLHVKMQGIFDGNSAHELLNLFLREYRCGGRVFVDTAGVSEVLPFGSKVLQARLCQTPVPASQLFFKGENGFNMAPSGSRVLIVRQHGGYCRIPRRASAGCGACRRCTGRRRRFPGWPVRRPGCRSVRVLRMGDR